MKNAAVGGLVITKVYAGKITQKRVNFMVYQKSAILWLFFLDLKEFSKVSGYKRIMREKRAKATGNLVVTKE